MKYRDLITLSIRSFRTNTSRTILTILGLGVGIGAVLFLVSLGYGLQNIILNKITTTDALLTLDVTSASDLITLDKDHLEAINSLDGVAETSPSLDLSGQITYDNETTDVVSFIIDKPFFRLSGLNFLAGKEFSASDANEVVVSSASAKIFGFANPTEMVGKRVRLNLFIPTDDKGGVNVFAPSADYEVIGVLEDENTSFVYIPLLTLGDTALPSYSGLKVKVKSSEQLNPVRDVIVKQGFMASSVSDTIDQTKKIFRIIQIVLGVFGLIALIVSAIGMFNTMTITLLERTQEIGIMRAIGVGHSDVAKLFLVESVIMGLMGGFSGVLIGYICGLIFNFVINILAKNFGGQALDLFYSPAWFILFIISFSTLTGFLTGLYPSRRAAKLNPLAALRYK